MQMDRSGLAAGRQQLSEIVHMGGRLMFRGKLLERNERRGQCFRDDPIVVAGDSLSRHSVRPFVLPPAIVGMFTTDEDIETNKTSFKAGRAPSLQVFAASRRITYCSADPPP